MAQRVARHLADPTGLPQWIRPQLTQLVDAAPDGPGWLHEIKFDGYRMHARLDRGAVRLLTRTGLDWTHKYPAIAAAVASLGAPQAYLDGELCGVRPDGVTSFSMIQATSDSGNAAALVFFLFDLLYLDGDDVSARPLIERKARLAELLSDVRPPLRYSDHQVGRGRAFHEKACAMSLEGIVSKRIDAPYAPGNRGLWRKVKCTARNSSWSAGPIPKAGAHISARCCSPTTIPTAGWSMPAAPAPASNTAELERLWRRLQPLATHKMPLDVPPPRTSRFGSPLVLSHVHWVRPELVAEVKFLTWTDDNLLRQVVYEGLREDKPASQVRRPVPHPQSGPPA
jgi:bifunctional non-homologous end joining protein LigD